LKAHYCPIIKNKNKTTKTKDSLKISTNTIAALQPNVERINILSNSKQHNNNSRKNLGYDKNSTNQIRIVEASKQTLTDITLASSAGGCDC
jgi:hypothetical protein